MANNAVLLERSKLFHLGLMDNRIASFLEDISVPVYDLRLGMFISNLDCGWAKTPFLIEGLLLKKVEEIETIQNVARIATVDLVRSEDYALKDYLESHVYFKRSLGDTKANTFTTRLTDDDEDIQPLTYDPGTAPVEKSLEYETAGQILKSRLRNIKAWLRQQAFPSKRVEQSSEFPKAPRPSYVPSNIRLVDHPETEFSWPAVRLAQETAKETIKVLEEVAQTIDQYRTIDADKIKDAADALAENIIVFPEAMIWVCRLRQKNNQLFHRSLQAAIYLIAFGRHLGFPQKTLAELAATGLLLDLGKTQIDEKLLNKNGNYSESEIKSVQRHVEIALALLGNSDAFPDGVRRAISEHHEWINGAGYPKGLSGNDISIFGKMAAIVDSYAAMINPRAYADTLAPHEAIKQLFAGANTHWFGPLVEQFVQSMGIYPIGSLVELASGHIAIVMQHNHERRLEPKILIVTHSDKRRRFPPLQIDLLRHNSRKNSRHLKIKQGLPDGAYGIDVQEFYSKRK